jgi:hypothetical protein
MTKRWMALGLHLKGWQFPAAFFVIPIALIFDADRYWNLENSQSVEDPDRTKIRNEEAK